MAKDVQKEMDEKGEVVMRRVKEDEARKGAANQERLRLQDRSEATFYHLTAINRALAQHSRKIVSDAASTKMSAETLSTLDGLERLIESGQFIGSLQAFLKTTRRLSQMDSFQTCHDFQASMSKWIQFVRANPKSLTLSSDTVPSPATKTGEEKDKKHQDAGSTWQAGFDGLLEGRQPALIQNPSETSPKRSIFQSILLALVNSPNYCTDIFH